MFFLSFSRGVFSPPRLLTYLLQGPGALALCILGPHANPPASQSAATAKRAHILVDVSCLVHSMPYSDHRNIYYRTLVMELSTYRELIRPMPDALLLCHTYQLRQLATPRGPTLSGSE